MQYYNKKGVDPNVANVVQEGARKYSAEVQIGGDNNSDVLQLGNNNKSKVYQQANGVADPTLLRSQPFSY